MTHSLPVAVQGQLAGVTGWEGEAGGIALIDRHGVITRVSAVWEALARESPLAADAVVGADFLAACRRAAAAGCPEAREVVAAIESVLGGTAESSVLEYAGSAAEEARWFELVAEPLAGPEGGAVLVHREITGRKRAAEEREHRLQMEAALRESETRREAILRALPDLMFLQSQDGIYLDYHARDPSQLLVPPEQFLGKRMWDVLPPELAAAFQRCFAEARATGEPVVYEYSLPLGGALQHFEARVVACDTDRVLSIVRDITERRRAEEAIRQRQAALRQSHAQVRDLAGRLIRAQEEERRRLARELHDDLSQQLAALAMAVSALQQCAGAATGEGERLPGLRQRIDSICGTVRDLSHALHPAVLEHAGLAAALETHSVEFSRRHGIPVALAVDEGLEPLAGDVALCLYRVVQESLHNVAKHSGAAGASVTLARHSGELRLRIEDPGSGFDLENARRQEGLGLVSMEERVHALGGTLRIETRPGAGTRLEVRLPLA
jgi:PAS domain S-box-containing protein